MASVVDWQYSAQQPFHFRKVNYEWSSVNSTSLKSTRNIIHKILGGSEASASTAIHSFLKQIINLLDATLRPWSLKPWRCGNSWQDKVSQSNDFLTTEKNHGISFISNLQGFGENIFIKPQKTQISLDHLLCIGCMSPSKPWKYPCWHRLRLCSHNFPSVSQGLGSPPARWLDKKNAPKTLMVFFQWLFLVSLRGGRWYIITYLLGEPETTIDFFLMFFLLSAIISCFNAPVFRRPRSKAFSTSIFPLAVALLADFDSGKLCTCDTGISSQ